MRDRGGIGRICLEGRMAPKRPKCWHWRPGPSSSGGLDRGRRPFGSDPSRGCPISQCPTWRPRAGARHRPSRARATSPGAPRTARAPPRAGGGARRNSWALICPRPPPRPPSQGTPSELFHSVNNSRVPHYGSWRCVGGELLGNVGTCALVLASHGRAARSAIASSAADAPG